MSETEASQRKGRRSPAYRDFRIYRRRLSRHLALLRAAGLDQAKHSRLAAGDQFDLPGDLIMACDYVERFIELSNARMHDGGEQERTTVADMNFLLGGILALVPSIARLAEIAGGAVKRDRSEEGARRASNATAKMIQAAEKARDLVEATERNPHNPHRPRHPGATWTAMRAVVDDDIDDKTARAYWAYCINHPRPETVGG